MKPPITSSRLSRIAALTKSGAYRAAFAEAQKDTVPRMTPQELQDFINRSSFYDEWFSKRTSSVLDDQFMQARSDDFMRPSEVPQKRPAAFVQKRRSLDGIETNPELRFPITWNKRGTQPPPGHLHPFWSQCLDPKGLDATRISIHTWGTRSDRRFVWMSFDELLATVNPGSHEFRSTMLQFAPVRDKHFQDCIFIIGGAATAVSVALGYEVLGTGVPIERAIRENGLAFTGHPVLMSYRRFLVRSELIGGRG